MNSRPCCHLYPFSGTQELSHPGQGPEHTKKVKGIFRSPKFDQYEKAKAVTDYELESDATRVELIPKRGNELATLSTENHAKR
jgi:hypothetical protein